MPLPNPFARLRRDRGQLYFGVLQFERFADLRNTVGFDIANRILRIAGERVRLSLRNAHIGRIGQCSVEFAFDAASDAQARGQLESCVELLERRMEVAGVEFRPRATIAFALVGAPDALITDALFDRVITTLAAEGGERVRLADGAEPSASGLEDLEILRALPRAIAEGELTLFYQPKLDCADSGISSAEALLRWNSPTLGQVSTMQIIALAERTGLIRDLTLWAVGQVASDQLILRQAGLDLTIFLNLSGVLIPDRPFMRLLRDLIAKSPGPLGIEITETAVISDPEAAIENLSAFSAAGIPVAIDDFGAGLSSLTYLKRLPADELKIDRLFITSLTESHRDPLIVRASIDLAHALDMKVTAEGVEDVMSLALLRVMGCDRLQGYAISRPVPLEALVNVLKSSRGGMVFPALERLPQRRLAVV